MTLPKEQFDFPDDFKDLILSKDCVAFIGSGPSIGKYDRWPDLVNSLCERCGIETRVNKSTSSEKLIEVAEEAKHKDKEAYYQYLGEHFGRFVEDVPILYDYLLLLPFKYYLTVNLDPLLISRARMHWVKSDVVIRVYPDLSAAALVKRSFHYLHGCIMNGFNPTDNTIVLAKSEFDYAYRPNSQLMRVLLDVFEFQHIVFIGYGLGEPAMKTALEICKDFQVDRIRACSGRKCTSDELPKRYILLKEPSTIDRPESEVKLMMEDREKEFRDMDVIPVWYPGKENDHSAMYNAFERLANLPTIQDYVGWADPMPLSEDLR